MGLINITYDEGQTALDEDEKDGLLLKTVTTKGDLNEVEQQNIEQALKWISLRRRRFKVEEILTEEFVKTLHKRMYGNVWAWAGEFRNSNKNIGVDKYEIGVSLKMLLDDCKYWIEHKVYGSDEIAIRFSHRIVFIHCFPNGNGRHSRLIADIVIERLLGGSIFSWGGGHDLNKPGETRNTYLAAVREADNGNYEPLLRFSRS